ncbi:hypothetical protein FQ154_07460 [Paeniglutamicibacter gangotriensis]|uniref:Glycosyl transferase n=1 Tax=Paeniglutamicibacter gangotriensis TaxID=254787 RepID=A0A5B0EI78_9MICC|nr:DUF6492 family protein [Paeniglutamicibacter gangotriensis]KAA0977551.1 hypothetical protein FQ154_07460 [Paeniglutamicibacter gangotriensis]
MKKLAILTPSFFPDIESFRRLHASVLRFADDSVVHHAIVPKRDVGHFQELGSHRLRVWSEDDFLPRGFLATGGLSALGRRISFLPRTFNCSAINLRRPWPPLRGWALQQILKMSAATRLDADGIIIIDSDVVLIRNLSPEQFHAGCAVRLYEKPLAVHSGMERHQLWTRVAHELLGLAWNSDSAFPDYVGGIISWDPVLVKQCLLRVEEVSGKPWATALSRQLHFSEFILYGTFVHNFGTAEQRSFSAPRTLCHSYWSPTPLDGTGAEEFIKAYDGNDIAVHIQSNSGTRQEIVDGVIEALMEGAPL